MSPVSRINCSTAKTHQHNSGRVYAYSETNAEYAVQEYYQPQVTAKLTDAGGTVLSSATKRDTIGYGYASVTFDRTVPASEQYTMSGTHTAIATLYDYDQGASRYWYDYFNFSRYSLLGIDVPRNYRFLGYYPVQRPRQSAIYLGKTSDTADAKPKIESISPARGLVGTTVAVTINGSKFGSGSTVSVGGNGVTASNVTRVSSTKITANLVIAAEAMSGNRGITVTSRGLASNSVDFYVQIPYAFTAISVTQTDLMCEAGTWGYGAQVQYQVVDEANQPITTAGMTPEEIFSVSTGGGLTEYKPFARPPTTDANGRFRDVPIGTCTNAPSNFCANVRQQFRIKTPTDGGVDLLHFLPTETTRVDCRDGIKVTVTTATNSQTFTLGTLN